MASAERQSREGRIVLVDHTAVLSGAELSLLDFAPQFDGAAVCLFEEGPLAAQLRARGVAVEVFGDGHALARVRRSSGLRQAIRALPRVWSLASELARRTTAADVLYANSQKSWIVCALTAWRARRLVVWHLHDIMSTAHFSRVLSRAAVFLANRLASAVIVNSKVTGEAFIAAGGDPGLVRVVHNGIDAAAFDPQGRSQRAAQRRALGLAEDAFVVGVFSRISPWKGQHVLLEALKRLPHVQAIVVGGALFGETDYLRELERRAREPALAGRVHFLGFREDVAALMQAVDVVAHTSTSPEPFGRVVVEGMLARRPVIATATGGVVEIVEHRVDGLLVMPGDPAALAEAISAVAGDAALRARLATAGREKAAHDFSLARMVAGLRGAVEEVRACRMPPVSANRTEVAKSCASR
jgi:glycosyltransferase involved in cell wall biosynthesis